MDQLKKFGAYAVCVGCNLLPLIFGDRETLPVVNGFTIEDQSKLSVVPDKSKKEYNKLVVSLFDDMAKYGYI